MVQRKRSTKHQPKNTKAIREKEKEAKRRKKAAIKKRREELMDMVNPMTGLTYRQTRDLEIIKGALAVAAATPGLVLACVQIGQMNKQQKQMNSDMKAITDAINNLTVK